MIDAESIVDLYTERSKRLSPLHVQMSMIRAIYANDAEVDLPDLASDLEQPAVPNLLAQGIDQTAGRIASVVPMIAFASNKPGSRTADRKAETARRALGAWWQSDRLMLKMRRRARHLIAYAMSPVVVRWEENKHRPCWEIRSPMQAWPNPDEPTGSLSPPDMIFAYRRSAKWLRQQGYGWAVASLLHDPEQIHTAEMLCIEYIDPEQRTLVLAGARTEDPWITRYEYATEDWPTAGTGRFAAIELETMPTEGVMTAFCPLRMTLDDPGGQFDSMIGMYYMQARLMALEVEAVAKGVYPDTYLVSRPGEIGRFIDGPHDGRSGKVNIVTGGDIKDQQTTPGYMTNPVIDRLERNTRVTSGIPSEFGGESPTNIRTGRRGELVLSSTIDFPVGEAQEIFAASLEAENEAAMKLAKFYDGSTPRTFYLGTGNAARPVTFSAADVFDHTEHVISYPAVGSDLNSLIVGLGQRVGMGTMSKQTAASLDPFIDAPELEHDRIIAEGLEQALVSGIQQQAATGAIPPAVIAKLIDLVANDKLEIAPAMNKIIEDAQKQQEQAAQQQGPPGAPQGAEAAIAGSAQQAIAGPSPMPGPTQGQAGLANLLGTLRATG